MKKERVGRRMTGWVIAALVLAFSLPVYGEEAPAPDVGKILEDLSKIGPDALINHFNEMKKQAETLTAEAANLRKQADELEAKAKTFRARIETIEKFMQNVVAALNPPPPPAPEPAPEKAPEPAPAEAAPPPAPEAPPAEQPAEASEPAPPAETASAGS